jgi:type VI secretion system secreted protein VgrG
MLTTQKKLDIKITTPLSGDPFVFDRLSGFEQISMPFCFSLSLHSQSTNLDLSKLVGGDVKVTFKYGDSTRYFCGIAGEVEQGRTTSEDKGLQTVYYLKVYPKFWLLKFSKNYKIFQNQSALDIIKAVLQENGVTDLEDKTSGCGTAVREYCVQYGESNFDFVCRLMEEEGIFYYFTHSQQTHTMILADDSTTAESLQTDSFPLTTSQRIQPDLNYVHQFNLQEQVVVKKFSADDFNFETPKNQLYTKAAGVGKGGHFYDYPGRFMSTGDGETIVNSRLHEQEWMKKTVFGRSTAPAFTQMKTFSLSGHPRDDANQTYLLYRVDHWLKQDAAPGKSGTLEELIYENEFKAFPSDVVFRPPLITKKNRIYSTQTAIVTGKSGEEIWCDQYGRIKVKFHWDQSGTENEDTSCWIRVAQMWSSSGWGTLFTPRIGMEVVVTFLEGDPDRPLITGCVYNGDNIPPYAQDEPTKSTIRSNTSKGGKGFNEIRFEDKKDSEEIFIHAQKDMNTIVIDSRTLEIKTGDDTTTIVEGDRTVTLSGKKGDRPQRGNDTLVLTKGSRTVKIEGKGSDPGNDSLEIGKGDQTILLKKGNQDITLKKGDRSLTLKKGNETITVKGERSVTVKNAETHVDKASFTHKVKEDYELTIKGSLTIKVQGAIVIKSQDAVTIKSTGDMTLKSGGDMKLEAGGAMNIKSGMAMNLKAGMGMDLKASMGMTAKADLAVEIQGLTTTVKGQTMAKVDGGPMLQLASSGLLKAEGSGSVMIQGGIVMIN